MWAARPLGALTWALMSHTDSWPLLGFPRPSSDLVTRYDTSREGRISQELIVQLFLSHLELALELNTPGACFP